MFWEEIESVELVEETEDVFDITVDSTHNFFADGICVHNCVAGVPSWATYAQFPGKTFDELTPDWLDDREAHRAVMQAVGNEFDRLCDAVGKDNVYAEIQFNKLNPQHLTNRVLMEFASSNGLKLVAAADSHYSSPELWRAREVYKLLGRMGRGGQEISPDSIPNDVKQLKCELYPKNSEQIWDSYKEYCSRYSFYDDETVRGAIENSWHIAHDVIGEVSIDNSMKLPSFGVRPGMNPFQTLVELCKEGMRKRQLAHKPEYVTRLKNELNVIKKLENAIYFLTLKSILDVARRETLIGCGRGSGAGSLVNFVLGITDVDPVPNKLIFARFMSLARAKNDYPDIDCLDFGHLVKTPSGDMRIADLEPNDVVYDASGHERRVLNVMMRAQRTDEIVYELLVKQNECYGTIVCNENHKMLRDNGSIVLAKDIVVGDRLLGGSSTRVERVNVLHGKRTLVDIEVEGSHTFQVIPYDTVIVDNPSKGDEVVSVNVYLDVDEQRV